MEVLTRCEGNCLEFFLKGELDHHGAKTAVDGIADSIDRYLPRDLVLDLTQLGFMDSSGIAVILKADRRIKETGGRLFIDCPKSQPLKVLEAAGIDRVVDIICKREVTT